MAQTEYTTAVLADSPVAFWKLDDASGLPQDSSGNGKHMTSSTGSVTYQYEAPFTGANSIKFNRVTSPTVDGQFSRSVVSTASANITLEAWIRYVTVDIGFTQNVIQEGDPTAPTFTVAVQDDAGGSVFHAGTSVLGWPATSWTHFAWTNNGSTLTFYINGDLWTSTSKAITTAAGNTVLGYDSDQNRTGAVAMSNVSLYDTLLSATRIRAHYEAAIGYTQKKLDTRITTGLALA